MINGIKSSSGATKSDKPARNISTTSRNFMEIMTLRLLTRSARRPAGSEKSIRGKVSTQKASVV